MPITFIRKSYNRKEIEDFVLDYKNSNNELYSPITKKVHKDKKSWKVSILYNLDKPSTNYFFFLLEKPHFSQLSNKKLTEEEFSYSETYKGWTGWKKYTMEEISTNAYKKIKRPQDIIERCRAGLKKFYATKQGKQVRAEQAKKAQISRNIFYASEVGKQTKKRARIKQSETMIKKIANGEWTPNATNSFTHWNASICINGITKKYRSSWELCFHLCYPHYEYEKIRIKYIDENNKQRVHITDFYDPVTNTLYELKPIEHFKLQQNKIKAAEKWCSDNNATFVWINENNLKYYIDKNILPVEATTHFKKLEKYYDINTSKNTIH